ncbi:MAG TPA: MFS transporter [Beijerinckiaceae bacterium]|jgi:YNFM family putative membrane transporter|nr:MFS transporter [Beijerinckiaceae bacterium]
MTCADISDISVHPRRRDRQKPANPPAKLDAQGGARRGTAAYRRISSALFLAGFATFSLLYCTQSLLPIFAHDFGISPATSSLALSLSTASLAIAILGAAAVSESVGRKSLMFAAIAGAALLNAAAAAMPNWPLLLVCRTLEGFVLGGVPAVAMAYLAEEVDRSNLGFSMGLYIGGSALGGMAGRVGASTLADWYSWHVAMFVIGIAGLIAAIAFVCLLPASRNFTRQSRFHPRYHLQAWRAHLADRGLLLLFAIGFLAMGAFVAIYNYAGFHLMAPPYALSSSTIGLIFVAYLFGIAASSTAGVLADRLGHRRVLPIGFAIALTGIALTVTSSLWTIIAGIVLLTIGFFFAHSVASSWIGRLAATAKGHASSLYLLAYYLGSSIGGTIGGTFLSAGGWPALAGFAGVCLLLGTAASLRLATTVKA